MSKYFPQHCVLEHPESTCNPLVEKQICLHIKNRKIYIVLMFTMSQIEDEKKYSEKSDSKSDPLNLPALDFFVNILLAFQSFSPVLDICNVLHFRRFYTYIHFYLILSCILETRREPSRWTYYLQTYHDTKLSSVV